MEIMDENNAEPLDISNLTDPDVLPPVGQRSLIQKLRAFYAQLNATATLDSQGNTVFEGYIIQTYVDAGLHRGEYGILRRTLEGMGSVYTIMRGTGKAKTILMLVKPPVEEELITYKRKRKETNKPHMTSHEVNEIIHDMRTELKTIEAQAEYRFKILEGKVIALQLALEAINRVGDDSA